MKITLIVEGKTEQAFKRHLISFLKDRLPQGMPKLDPLPYAGRIPVGDKLRKDVVRLLRDTDHVIALTDVYTGNPKTFSDANDAKAKMRAWVGNEPRFHPHVALHDFEAWLLPYWTDIQRLAKHNKAVPSVSPEAVNHNRPPSFHVKEVFRTGKSGREYSKIRDANAILTGKDLAVAAAQCLELRAFLNTILKICNAPPV